MKNKTTEYRLRSTTKKHLTCFRLTIDKVGFTLVELLVAISIMSLVFGLLITSAVGVRRRARDQQRVTDLQKLQQVLASYYADQNFYPDSSFDLSSATTITNVSGNSSATLSKTYLTVVPQDPGAIVYKYLPWDNFTNKAGCDNTIPNNSCQYYLICAHSESIPASPSTICVTQFGVNYNYEVNPNHSTTL